MFEKPTFTWGAISASSNKEQRMNYLRTEKPTEITGQIKMTVKPMLFAVALLASTAISTLASAQPDASEYAPNYIIVKVHPGVFSISRV